MITGKNQKLSQADKEGKRVDLNAIRDMTEANLMGGFELIYPLDEIRVNEAKAEEYATYLEAAQSHYDIFNTGRGVKRTFGPRVQSGIPTKTKFTMDGSYAIPGTTGKIAAFAASTPTKSPWLEKHASQAKTIYAPKHTLDTNKQRPPSMDLSRKQPFSGASSGLSPNPARVKAQQ